jgi:acyl-CoA synthetase (AMP-forming)/AMP-acid ligase II
VSGWDDWPWLIEAPTFDGLVAARAGATPDAPFLYDEEGTVVTCRQFARQVDRVAAGLALVGIGPGSRVAWQLPTRIGTVLVLAALRRLDAVQAPIIPLYRHREVGAALRTSRAEFFIVPDEGNAFDFVAMANELSDELDLGLSVIAMGHEPAQSSDLSVLPPRPEDPGAVHWIYFTSGSTGAPKGAQHSDTSLLVPGRAFAGIGQLGRAPDEVAGMGFPIAHVGGVEYLIAALAGGYPILLLESFVPAAAVALFRHYRVTTTGGAPPFYQALAAMARTRSDGRMLPDLRVLKGGGAPCSPELFAEVRDALGVVVAHDFGMTEVPMIAVAHPGDPDAVLASTDGRPIPGNAMRIVDPDGRRVADSEVGEIQVKGKGVCLGYTDPAETALAFDDTGWFKTGDLGRLVDGHLEVVGRLKDMIIRKGENIAPAEIESLLSRHPAVVEVAVIGLPDAERGELACAVVVARRGVPAPTLEQLTRWLLDRGLLRQKAPERLELVDALPRTGLAKIAKTELRTRFAGAPTRQ